MNHFNVTELAVDIVQLRLYVDDKYRGDNNLKWTWIINKTIS